MRSLCVKVKSWVGAVLGSDNLCSEDQEEVVTLCKTIIATRKS